MNSEDGKSAVATQRRSDSRQMGFTGDVCPNCQNFTMARNGTCLKCMTCGETTGCS